VLLEHRLHFAPIGRRAAAQALLLEVIRKQAADVAVVVDDKDVVLMVHRAVSMARILRPAAVVFVSQRIKPRRCDTKLQYGVPGTNGAYIAVL